MARAPLVADIDALPEADRLDDFPHPRETRALYGHEGAQSIFAEALAGDRMHHAWLLCRTGWDRQGDARLSSRSGCSGATDERDLFGQGLAIEPDSRTDRQVRALSHPGLFIIRRPYDQKTKRFAQIIPIDEVRRLKAFWR